MPSNDQQSHPQYYIATRERTNRQTNAKIRVVFWNDDVTTFEFVIDTLVEVFNYEVREACLKALEVDQQGKSTVGTYVKDIAEAKREETLKRARKAGFPLKVTLEA